MKNTPAFIFYGKNLNIDGLPHIDRVEVVSVIMRLARHGSAEVAEALSIGAMDKVLNAIHAGSHVLMASKTWCEHMPIAPLDEETVEGETLLLDLAAQHHGHSVRCYNCGALCVGPVWDDGCNMCDGEVDEYYECDCDVSGGFEDSALCVLHNAAIQRVWGSSLHSTSWEMFDADPYIERTMPEPIGGAEFFQESQRQQNDMYAQMMAQTGAAKAAQYQPKYVSATEASVAQAEKLMNDSMRRSILDQIQQKEEELLGLNPATPTT